MYCELGYFIQQHNSKPNGFRRLTYYVTKIELSPFYIFFTKSNHLQVDTIHARTGNPYLIVVKQWIEKQTISGLNLGLTYFFSLYALHMNLVDIFISCPHFCLKPKCILYDNFCKNIYDTQPYLCPASTLTTTCC